MTLPGRARSPETAVDGLSSEILDATDSLVIVTDIRSGLVVGINTAAETLIGLPRADVVGKSLWDICAPEDRGAVADFYASSRFERLPRTYETIRVSASGAHHHITWSSRFLSDRTGQRTHVVMTGVDVTAGRATDSLFGQLMNAATTIILIGADAGGRINYCSVGAERMLDTAHHDLVGRWLPAAAFGTGRLSSRIAAVARPECAQDLGVQISHHDRRSARPVDLGLQDRRSRERQPGTGASTEDWRRPRDWMITHPNGDQLIAEMTVTQVTNSLGERSGYLLVGCDVTEQRRSKDLLVSRLAKEAAAIEALRELDRIKTDLLATVSHELRTPLASILANVELLKDEEAGPLSAQQRKLADAVDRNGERLLALVNDLLTASSIDAGKLRSDSSPVDLRDVVSSARQTLRPLIDRRDLTAHFRMPVDPVVVQGDVAQLEQVVCNLLSNAVKFTEDGGTVDCAVDVRGTHAQLTVSDDGMGIPEDEQPHLFQRFFRSTTASDRAIQGTGLGLSIASSIVASHGGDISVVSSPGKGTVVTVDLPLAGSWPDRLR